MSKRLTTKECKFCGREFEAKRIDAMYCGNTCKQYAYENKKKYNYSSFAKLLNDKKIIHETYINVSKHFIKILKKDYADIPIGFLYDLMMRAAKFVDSNKNKKLWNCYIFKNDFVKLLGIMVSFHSAAQLGTLSKTNLMLNIELFEEEISRCEEFKDSYF
ncbi:MAG: hypothetical protein WC223_06250 [Bacteroidales bacterium]|jgi:hypothetical protein